MQAAYQRKPNVRGRVSVLRCREVRGDSGPRHKIWKFLSFRKRQATSVEVYNLTARKKGANSKLSYVESGSKSVGVATLFQRSDYSGRTDFEREFVSRLHSLNLEPSTNVRGISYGRSRIR